MHVNVKVPDCIFWALERVVIGGIINTAEPRTTTVLITLQ